MLKLPKHEKGIELRRKMYQALNLPLPDFTKLKWVERRDYVPNYAESDDSYPIRDFAY